MISLTKLILGAALALSASYASAQSYETPVVDENGDTSFAEFKLQNFSLFNDDKTMKLTYDLPVELTGVVNNVELTGILDGSRVAHLNGPLGNATCDLSTSNCRVIYKSLQLDAQRAESILKSMNLNPAQLSALMAAGIQFRADPIGFVKLK